MFDIQNWNLIDYEDAQKKQKQLVLDIQQGKANNTLVFCEHPTVITVGRNGSLANIIQSCEYLSSKNVKTIFNDRGGDVTLHNPGQLVGYPIFDLNHYKKDLHWFLREIEECIIQVIATYNIIGHRINDLTGVWIENRRKICAMGFHCNRWVTSHGFALNVNNNLNEFDMIVPCGIKNKEITSIEKEIGTPIAINTVKEVCEMVFENHF